MHLNWEIRILFKWMDGWVTLQWHAFRLTLKIVWVVSLETLEIKQAGSDLQERSKGQGQGHGPTWDNKKPEIMKEGQVNSKNFRANTNAFCREDVCERKTFFLCAYTCVFLSRPSCVLLLPISSEHWGSTRSLPPISEIIVHLPTFAPAVSVGRAKPS